jgi:hypothetical protein
MEWDGRSISCPKADIGKYIDSTLFHNLIMTYSAVTDFTVTLGRSSVISFSQPITKVYNMVFIKNPTGAFNFNAYTEPLTYQSWVAIKNFLIAVPPVVYLIIRYFVFIIIVLVESKYLL